MGIYIQTEVKLTVLRSADKALLALTVQFCLKTFSDASKSGL